MCTKAKLGAVAGRIRATGLSVAANLSATTGCCVVVDEWGDGAKHGRKAKQGDRESVSRNLRWGDYVETNR